MSTIYEQAIADAKRLKEVAEQNATNKIIESIAPRIRRLIEQEIAGEVDPDLTDEPDEFSGDELPDADPLAALPDDVSAGPESMASDLEAVVDSSDAMDSDEAELEDDMGDEGITELEDEKNVTVNITVESRLNRRAKKLRERAIGLVIKLKESKSKKQKQVILSELKKIRKQLVLTNPADRKLGKEINEVLKESVKMSRRNKNSWINENAWWLFEAEEGEEGGDDELDLDLEDEGDEGDDEAGGEDVDVDAVKAAVEDLASAIGMEVEAEAGGDEEDEGDEDEDEGDDEELDLGEMDMKIDDAYRSNEAEEDSAYKPKREMHGRRMRYEADGDEGKEPMEEADDDDKADEALEEIEINEAAIRRELARMRRARRNRSTMSERRRRLARRRLAEMGDPLEVQDHFGGSEEVIEVDEETLINALAEELGDAAGEELNIDGQGEAASQAAHYGGGSVEGEAMSESRRRRIARRRLQEKKFVQNQRKLALKAQREAAVAKRELKESNLFNAKLLYVNKLMQQHDLNAKQQRAIVEALDNAKTHREAKLLYTSLTESLRRREQSRSSSNLNEGLVRGGSGSSPARSSAPAKQSKGLDRWATLAGIKK